MGLPARSPTRDVGRTREKLVNHERRYKLERLPASELQSAALGASSLTFSSLASFKSLLLEICDS